MATADALSVRDVDSIPAGAVYTTRCRTFRADAIEVAAYQDKMDEYNDNRARGCGERTEFNKLAVAKRVKEAQQLALRAGEVTNAHVINREHTSWCRLNRNPLDLSKQSYRSIWTKVTNCKFVAILRRVPLEDIQLPFVFHRFTADCKHIETVLVTGA